MRMIPNLDCLEIDGDGHVPAEVKHFGPTVTIGTAFGGRELSVIEKPPYKAAALRALERRLGHEWLNA